MRERQRTFTAVHCGAIAIACGAEPPSGPVYQAVPVERRDLVVSAEAAGVEITAECHSGICGSDPLRIVSGAEYLETGVGDQERETLEELCEVEAGPCRLACMTRVKGPVVVEILRQE